MFIKPVDASVTLKGMFNEDQDKVDLVFYCAGDQWPGQGFVSINVRKSFSIRELENILTNSVYLRHGVKINVMLSDPYLHGTITVHDGMQSRVDCCAIMRNGQTVNVNMRAYYSTKEVSSLTFNFNVKMELIKEEPVVALKAKEQPVQEIDLMDPNAARGLQEYHKDMVMMVLSQPHTTVAFDAIIPVFFSGDHGRDMEKETVPYTLRVNKLGSDYVIFARIAGAGNVPVYTRIPYHKVTLTMLAHISMAHSPGLAVTYAKWLSNKFKNLNALGIIKLKDMDSAKGVMDTPISMFYKQIVSVDTTHKQSAMTELYQTMLRQIYHTDINKALYLDWVTASNEQPAVVQDVNLVSINHGQLDKYLAVMSPDVVEEAIHKHLKAELETNAFKRRTVAGTISQLEAVRDAMKADLKTYTDNITQQIDNIDKDIAERREALPILDTTAEQIKALLGPKYQR